MLNSVPLYTAILGLLCLIMIVAGGGTLRNNRPARWLLIVIVLLAIHYQLDAYLYYNDLVESRWLGLSMLHYHLIGALFLVFTHKLFRIDLNLKRWGTIIISYTVIRTLFLIPEDPTAYENFSDDIGWTDVGIVLDNFISNALNIAALWLAFVRTRNLDFDVQLDKREKINYLWLKNLLQFQIGVSVFAVITTVITFFYVEDWLTFWKVETMVSGFFFLVLAFFAIRFPVFSVYGDFNDLKPEEKKYANSSLTGEGGKDLWQEINSIMHEERPYLNAEYRLNELADRTGQSIHHVSQVINQQQGGSFTDFINALRIKEAQNLLKSERAQQVTILAIALESGFNSKTAFYNAFKKATGQTPSDFIKGHPA